MEDLDRCLISTVVPLEPMGFAGAIPQLKSPWSGGKKTLPARTGSSIKPFPPVLFRK